MKKTFWQKTYDISPYIVLAGITLWLVLKVLGIINTPRLIEYAPIFGAVYLAGFMISKLLTTVEDVGELKKEMKTINTRIITLECTGKIHTQ